MEESSKMKMENEKPIFWMLSDEIPKAFSEGCEAWNVFAKSRWRTKNKNPYKPKTNSWYSWNKGYNMNDKGLSDLNPI